MIGDNIITTLDAINRNAMKSGRTLNTKAECILKRYISHDLFKHIIGYKSTSKFWITSSIA